MCGRLCVLCIGEGRTCPLPSKVYFKSSIFQRCKCNKVHDHHPLHSILEMRLADEARSYEITCSPKKTYLRPMGKGGGSLGGQPYGSVTG